MFDWEIRWEKRWWEKGLHGVKGGANHVMVSLVVSFDFSIGGRVVAMSSFEDEVEFVVKHLAEFSVSGKGAIFVSSESDDFMALTEECGDEKTDEVKRGSFAGGGKDPRI